jgi:alpha-tubulin suppressor-like RCC1 family protein
VIEPDEQCEVNDLGNATCESLGYVGGSLGCSALCRWNLASCHRCGDGVADPGEACDGEAPAGLTCASLPGVTMTGEIVGCMPDCRLNTTGCVPPSTCGDGVRDAGEGCDGDDLGGQTCAGLDPLRFAGGSLSCTFNCLVDPAGCLRAPPCGNGLAEPVSGEVCDGTDLTGAACADLGLGGGPSPARATAPSTRASACRRPDGVGVLEGVVTATTGFEHTCATTQDGRLLCWGRGASGQLGVSGISSSRHPVEVTALPDVARAAAGGRHTCAVDLTGALWCWGANEAGQLGTGDATPSGVPRPVTGPLDPVVIGSGESHTCAQERDGDLRCWGWNAWGQVGDGTWTDRYEPVLVATSVVQMAVGGSSTCVEIDGHGRWCWGGNSVGQLGNGRSTRTAVPVLAQGGVSAAAVTAGRYHACARDPAGGAWCWGELAPSLGDGVSTWALTPVQVVGPEGLGLLADVSVVASGEAHSCARLGDGTLWCWGENSAGRLGDGTQVDRAWPVQVLDASGLAGLTGVLSLGLGRAHSCAALDEGTAWCWGDNSRRQLGDGTLSFKRLPVQVRGPGGVGVLDGVVRIAAGGRHTCALRSDGTLWCWGDNSYRQLGDGTQSDRAFPTQVVGPDGLGLLEGVETLSLGREHTCASRGDGSAYCWGYGGSGRLGTGSTASVGTPTLVLIDAVTALAAGDQYTCALIAGGASVACWGYGTYGQLGDGSYRNSAVSPVEVIGLTDVTSLSVRERSTCATTGDGSLYCWGSNADGQLANPDYYHQPSAVPVQPF